MLKEKMLNVRVSMPLIEQMDEWRAARRPIPTRAEVLRVALEKLLEEEMPLVRRAVPLPAPKTA